MTNNGYAAVYSVTDDTNSDYTDVEGYSAENHTVTRTVTLTVNKADPTAAAPTGLTATFGQTLADVKLTNPDGNTEGTWAWADSTAGVGNAGTNTFKANFTPKDTANYNSKENVDVTVTVGEEQKKPSGMLFPLLTSKGKNKLELTWQKMQGVDGYDIEMTLCYPTKFKPVASVSADTESYTFKKLKKNTAYKVKLQAYVQNADGTKQHVGVKWIVHSVTGNGAVYANPKKITLKDSELKLAVGGKATLSPKVTPDRKKKDLHEHFGLVTYISSNPSVASVNDKGTVKGISAGSCTIYAIASNGYYTSMSMTVEETERIAFKEKGYKVKAGKSINLKKELRLTDIPVGAKLTWKSSDESIATVNMRGKVKGKKEGSVIITVSVGELEAKVKVRVK